MTTSQRAVLGDHQLSEEQKQALLRIYLSFRHEQDAHQEGPPDHG